MHGAVGFRNIGIAHSAADAGDANLSLAALWYSSQPGLIVPWLAPFPAAPPQVVTTLSLSTAYLRVLASSKLINPALWSLLSPLQRTILVLVPTRLGKPPSGIAADFHNCGEDPEFIIQSLSLIAEGPSVSTSLTKYSHQHDLQAEH
jgi:hypothetical protein